MTDTRLVDIGANLTSGRFHPDLEAVLARAQAAGVSQILVTGTDLEVSREALALAEAHPGFLHATAGVHPHNAKHWSPGSAPQLAALLKTEAVVALGECGLDFNRNFSPPDDQLACFEAQLAMAGDCQKPVFLHQRDAHEAFMPLLRRYRKDLVGAVVHCFTGSEAELRDYLALDCYIGITGWLCDQRRGGELRELVSLIPDQRLLIETDAPYLLPHNLLKELNTKRNEPAFLPYVLRTLAECRGQSPERLATVTGNNARRLFGL